MGERFSPLILRAFTPLQFNHTQILLLQIMQKKRRATDISHNLLMKSKKENKIQSRSVTPNSNFQNDNQKQLEQGDERNLIQLFDRIQLEDLNNITPINFSKKKRAQNQLTPNVLDLFNQRDILQSPKRARTSIHSDEGRSVLTQDVQVEALKRRINFMHLQQVQMKKAMQLQKKKLQDKESLIKQMKKEYDQEVKRLEKQRDQEILKRFENQKEQLAIYQQEQQSRQNEISQLKNQNKQLRVDIKKLQSGIMILKINNLSQQNKLGLPMQKGWKAEAIQNSLENFQTNPSSQQSPQVANKTFNSYIFDTPVDLAKRKMQAQEQLAQIDPAYRIESEDQYSGNSQDESQGNDQEYGISEEHKLKRRQLGLI